MKFVVHHHGIEIGPWSTDEILKKIESKEVDWSDYVYDSEKQDWIFILLHPQFAEHFRKSQMATYKKVGPSPASAKSSSAPVAEDKPTPYKEPEWFVLRDDNRFGPFTRFEIIRMLQQKKLFEYDYVWNRPLMTTWQRISEVPDFQSDKIKALKKSGEVDENDVFFRRRHARATYGASIILHNNKEVWSGSSIEVSAGGAGLVLETDIIQVGQSLFLHFKAGDGVPPFNATCVIVSKHQQGSDWRYGVRFTSISQTIQRAIKKFTDSAA